MKKVLLLIISVFALGCKKDDATNGENSKDGMSSVINLNLGEANAKIMAYSYTGKNPNSPQRTPGAKVSLFHSAEDAVNNKNIIATGITNNEGVCTFEGLKKDATYYVRVEKECLSNLESLHKVIRNEVTYGNEILNINYLNGEYPIYLRNTENCK